MAEVDLNIFGALSEALGKTGQRLGSKYGHLADPVVEAFTNIPSPVERARAAAASKAPVDSTEGRFYRSGLTRDQFNLNEKLRNRQ